MNQAAGVTGMGNPPPGHPPAGRTSSASKGRGSILSPTRGGPAASVNPESGLAICMVAVIGVMLLPLPTVVLDLLLALSVGLALVIFLFSLHIERPLEFSAFPSVLLLITLMRLSLNVASTRTILLKGHEGPTAAGKVLYAFGQFVVGGNTVVGIIVFLILVVINFVVITKGAGRIAEVAARFALDGMPGKQMAIDADLGAGLISDSEATARRRALEHEADFFGSMDGASKFVRGDAIAGLLITVVNIIGGLIVGLGQHDLDVFTAAETFTQLTIGDGLVSQVPALLTSIAAGLVTTRASTGGHLGETVRGQLFGSKRPVQIAALVLGALALVPGMPHLAFLVMATCLGVAAHRMKDPGDDAVEPDVVVEGSADQQNDVQSSIPVELLEIEVGYELVPLVDSARDGALLKRISGVRKQIAKELGILVPPIHMRDNLRIRPSEYRVLLSGQMIATGELRMGLLLAMDPDGRGSDLRGEKVIEPAFGLPGVWIHPADQDRAELSGYTVVDAATVAATHLGEVLSRHASELLGRREIQDLLDLHGKEHARAIEDLVPNQMSVTLLTKVLRLLLRERVSIRDFRSVLDALSDHAESVKDAEQLAELVRRRLCRQLTHHVASPTGEILALVLAPAVEGAFRRLQNQVEGGPLDPNEVRSLVGHFERTTGIIQNAERLPAILVPADIRRAVSTFAARHIPGLTVMSFRELDEAASVRTIGVIGEIATLENRNHGLSTQGESHAAAV